MSDQNSVPRLGARPFADRHIGPDETATAEMLKAVGFDSLDALMEAAVPGRIRVEDVLNLPEAASEAVAAAELRALAGRNNAAVPMIGLGYHGTITPPVIRRNVLEDPSWYTAYTPYQPEISQGRLEALLNFQTVVADLTGLPTANASLLDEGTAAAEAMTLVRRAQRNATGPFVVDADALPQTIDVVRTRAEGAGGLEKRQGQQVGGDDGQRVALVGLVDDRPRVEHPPGRAGVLHQDAAELSLIHI